MANKKISELDSRASLSLSDLMAVGDPSTGYLYKTTISDLKTLTGAGVISFNGRFGAVSPAEGDYNLTQLGDVIIASASNGQVLQFNGSNWVNAALPAEADTLDSVTDRGNTTTNDITVGSVTAAGLSNLLGQIKTFATTGNVYIGESPVIATDAGYKLDVSGSTRVDSLTVKSATYPTYVLTIQHLATGRQRITGGYGSEWIEFGEGGNSMSLRANEIYFQSGNNVFSDNAVIQSRGTSGLVFSAANFYQQGDTRYGFQFYGNYTAAVASGVSTLNLVGYNPIILTSVGTINGSVISISPTINTTGGTTNWNAIHYNPTITGTTGLDHYFINAVSGKVKLGDLAGTGTRIVTADANGVLSAGNALSGYVPYTGATSNVTLGNNSMSALTFISGAGIFLSTAAQSSPGLTGGTVTAINGKPDGIEVRPSDLGSFRFIFPSGNNRNYTFPNSDGTVALTSDIPSLTNYVTLNGTQTISGAKTFSAIPVIDNGSAGMPLRFKMYASSSFGLNGYMDIAPVNNTGIVAFAFGVSPSATKIAYISAAGLTDNTARTFTLPDASGTLALTSNLSSYVPYQGATAEVNLGNNALLGKFLFVEGDGSLGGILSFKQYESSYQTTTNHTNIYATSVNKINFSFYQSSSVFKLFNFDVSSLGTTSRTYTMPDASGTLTLGSGTSGYISKFTGTNAVGNSVIYDDGSKVGIGLTNPQRVLEIYSATADNHLRLSGAAPSVSMGEAVTGSVYQAKFGLATATNNYVTGSVAGDFVINSQTGSILWGLNAVLGMKLASNGNLGIGTGSPAGKLHVETSSGSSLLRLSAAAVNTRYLYTITGGADDAFTLTRDHATAGTMDIMTWTYSGKVGIGTNSPVVLLHGLIPSVTNTDTEIFRLTDGVLCDFKVRLKRGTDANSSTAVVNTYSGIMSFETNNTERMRLTGAGTLGIAGSGDVNNANGLDKLSIGYLNSNYGWIQTFAGTPLVLNKLGNNVLIGGTSSNGFKLEVFNSGVASTDSTGSIYMQTNGGGEGVLAVNTANPLRIFTNGSERMRITSGGNVLIGTTTYGGVGVSFNPIGAAIFNYSGTGTNTNIEFKNSNGTVGYIQSSGSSTSYITSSDYRLKQDLKDFNGLSLVSAIKTYDYQWKADQTRAFGVLAHELQEVLPQAVTGEKDGEQIQGVDYSKIVPVLVKALQEQQAQIESLKAQLN